MVLHENGKYYIALSESEKIEITQDILEIRDQLVSRSLIVDYPNVRSTVQVRELFVRIYDQLRYEIIRSDETYPNYILKNKQTGSYVQAHVFLSSSEYDNEKYPDCDLVICWENALGTGQVDVLELKERFDLFGSFSEAY